MYFVCFVRKQSLSFSNEILWLQDCVRYRFIDFKVSQFSQEKSLKTVETCGSYATHALPPFINLTASVSPAEHDINTKRVIWDWLLWNDNQTSHAGKEKEQPVEGQKETQSSGLLILPSFLEVRLSRWLGNRVQSLSSWHATWRHVWLKIYEILCNTFIVLRESNSNSKPLWK